MNAHADLFDPGTPIYYEWMSEQPHDSYVRTLFHPEVEQLPPGGAVAPVVAGPEWVQAVPLAALDTGTITMFARDALSTGAIAMFVGDGAGVPVKGGPSVLVLDPADWSVVDVDWPPLTTTLPHKRTDLQYKLAGALMAEHGQIAPTGPEQTIEERSGA